MSSRAETSDTTITSAVRNGDSDTLSDRVKSLRLSDPSAAKSRRGGSSGSAWFLCLCFAGATSFLGYREWERTQQPTDVSRSDAASATSPASAAKTSSADAAADTARPGDIVLESKGYIFAKHSTKVSPKVSGVIQDLYVDEGKLIKKDGVIAVLETDEYRFDRDRALAVYNAAKAKLMELEVGNQPEEKEQSIAEKEEAEAQLKQSDLAHKRNQLLRRSASAAAADVEQSEASWRAMAARVKRLENSCILMLRGPRQEKKDVARAEVAQAKADLDRCQWRLDNCTIKSPINGIVLEKKAEQGDMVNAVALQGAFSICEICDPLDLEVEVNIQERDFARIYEGQKCKVRPLLS
jgi:multidrug efflux pump subunit AcrA (membrane-fusion protein)